MNVILESTFENFGQFCPSIFLIKLANKAIKTGSRYNMIDI